MENTKIVTVLDIIEELRNTTSLNEKKEIIKKYSHLSDFTNTLKYTYDLTKVFGIKKIPEYSDKTLEDESYLPLSRALFDMEEMLIKQKLRGHAAINFVKNIFENTRPENRPVLELIIKKDLRCGINLKLIQQVLPDLIQTVDYMGAVPFDKKKIMKIINTNQFIFSQEKMDGEYSNLIIDNNSITFLSRRNKIQNVPEVIINNILQALKIFKENYYIPDNIILNGELIIEGFPRLQSNGMLTRIFKYQEYLKDNKTKQAEKSKAILEEESGLSYEELISKIKYYIWDYQNPKEDYLSRWILLTAKDNPFIQSISFFEIVPTKIFINKNNNFIDDQDNLKMILKSLKPWLYQIPLEPENIYKKLMNHFFELIEDKKEGSLVKSAKDNWKSGKPVFQVKIKLEIEFELRIKKILPGDPGKKFENTLGRVWAESEDGLLGTHISGFKDDERDYIWNHQDLFIDKIITVKANFISKPKDNDIYSCGHPRIIKYRDDKDKANTLEEILEIQNSVMQVK